MWQLKKQIELEHKSMYMMEVDNEVQYWTTK